MRCDSGRIVAAWVKTALLWGSARRRYAAKGPLAESHLPPPHAHRPLAMTWTTRWPSTGQRPLRAWRTGRRCVHTLVSLRFRVRMRALRIRQPRALSSSTAWQPAATQLTPVAEAAVLAPTMARAGQNCVWQAQITVCSIGNDSIHYARPVHLQLNTEMAQPCPPAGREAGHALWLPRGPALLHVQLVRVHPPPPSACPPRWLPLSTALTPLVVPLCGVLV